MPKGLAGSVQRVLQSVLPKEEEFFSLLADMTDKVMEGAEVLRGVTESFDRLPEAVTKIEEIEHETDRLNHECKQRLNATFVTPILFDREDIFELANELDDIVDFMKAAIDRISLYEVREMKEPAMEMARIIYDCAVSLKQTGAELKDLHPDRRYYTDSINALENEGDHVLKNGLAHLFKDEKDPIEVIKWKEIYDYLEEAIDRFEDTVAVIEAAVVKNS